MSDAKSMTSVNNLQPGKMCFHVMQVRVDEGVCHQRCPEAEWRSWLKFQKQKRKWLVYGTEILKNFGFFRSKLCLDLRVWHEWREFHLKRKSRSYTKGLYTLFVYLVLVKGLNFWDQWETMEILQSGVLWSIFHFRSIVLTAVSIDVFKKTCLKSGSPVRGQ